MPARSVSGAHTSVARRSSSSANVIASICSTADHHAAVAEPLGDAHAAIGRHLADDRPERAEDPAGGVVAEGRRVVREPGEVDEDERAGHTHAAT